MKSTPPRPALVPSPLRYFGRVFTALMSLALAVWSGGLRAQVSQLGTAATATEISGSQSSRTFSYSVPPGNDRLLVVTTAGGANTAVVTSVTFNTIPMIQRITTATGTSRATIYTLSLGSSISSNQGNVVVTYSDTFIFDVNAFAFQGVDQTTPISGAVSNSAQSLTVASATNDLVIDAIVGFGSGPAVGAGQTLRANNNNLVFGSPPNTGVSTEPGAASVAMDWTGFTSGIAHVALNLRAAAAVAPVAITTTTLPNAVQNVAGYSQTLVATGGTGAKTFAVLNGALPTGLSLNLAGTISGTPTAAGTFNFTISAVDTLGVIGQRAFSITVTAAATPLAITTTALPSAVFGGGAYASIVAATGGSGVYTFIVSGGTLPAGLAINAGTGAISGFPTTLGTSSFTVVVTDSLGTSVGQSLSIAVNLPAGAAQTITFAALADRLTTDAPFALTATASSSLPVSFFVSGPATITGSTLTLTGAAGLVTVTALQAGNASFAAAANVVRTFNVNAPVARVFFGPLQGPPPGGAAELVAAGLAADGRSGTLILHLGGTTGEAFAVDFTLRADGTFGATAAAFNQPATASRTFNGAVSGGTLTVTVPELARNFTLSAPAAAGPAVAIAGIYRAGFVGTNGGLAYAVVGPAGTLNFLVATPTLTTVSARGAVGADNRFNATPTTTAGVTVSGGFDPAGTLTGTVNGIVGSAGGVNFSGPLSYSGLALGVTRTDRLIGLAARARVGTGLAGTLINGFSINGPAAKRVLLRAVGPGLIPLGLPGAVPNPSLRLFDSTGRIILENDDWSGDEVNATAARVGTFPLAAGSRDAAVITTLAPGNYSMHVLDGGGTGVAVAEIYDASTSPSAEPQRLLNIASRGNVDGGAGVLVGGFVVTGNSPKRVLVRGIGPTLAEFAVAGALADPQLTLFAGSTIIAQNDDWGTPQRVGTSQVAATAAEIAAAAQSVAAFRLSAGTRDAALIITLAPGGYTAQVSAAAAGVALIEIYELP